MRVLIVDHFGGDGVLDYALRCIGDGHRVKWFFKRGDRNKDFGRGLVDIVDDWRPWMRWADLVVLADNTHYLREIDAWRRNEGIPVIGATQDAAAWELNRTLGQGIMKRCGIDVPPFKEFKDYDTAIAHVKRTGLRYVSKPCYDETDKSLSYVSKGPADMVYMLQRWKKSSKLKGSFILQEFKGGCEMAVGGWFGPGGFNRGWCENFEFKKLMAGDTGPATGEMGTVLRYVRQSKLADLVLKPVEDDLERIGYCGYVDVNCIIDEEGNPWPLEFTMRFGWPTFNIQQALHEGDHAEWLLELAEGRDAKACRLDEVAIGVVLALPDFPYSQATRKDVTGVPIYGYDPSMTNIHFCEVMAGTAPQDVNGKVVDLPCHLTAGDYLLVASGTGPTIRSARKSAYALLEEIKVPNSPFFRPDIGLRLQKQLPQIQAKGFARGLVF